MILSTLLMISACLCFAAASQSRRDPPDLCAVIGGKKWVNPMDLRRCFSSFKVDPEIKANIIDVINKTLAFHTSVNFQILAPAPFDKDVHEDILADLARISHHEYASEYDMHIDLSRSVKRLNDGHCVYINRCYDALFFNFIPLPLVLVTEPYGSQTVRIAPEAFQVATAEFADNIEFWQKSLPGGLKDKLESLSGATVLEIDGKEPFEAVNQNAETTGTFEAFGTRQNAFFSSYGLSQTGYTYAMGNFAQQTLPQSDEVELTVVRINSTSRETFKIPYSSRFGPTTSKFSDSVSFRQRNCVAVNNTNGADLNVNTTTVSSAQPFRQAPPISPQESRKYMTNILLDTSPPSNIVLPPPLQPPLPVGPGSAGVAQFYMLEDNTTGVLALGSFASDDFIVLQNNLLSGLQALKSSGAKKLIVDVTANGGGFVCIAYVLARIIVGPTEGRSFLDTEARDGPLAQLIVKNIITKNLDPNGQLLFNPILWSNASDVPFPPGTDWLDPPINKTINGRADAFSQRLGNECEPFPIKLPDAALFDTHNVVIVGNTSSCSLFSIAMSKIHGVKTVVVAGRNDVPQDYCGTVGGQSVDFFVIDTEVKTAQLKDNPLAPPDFTSHSVMGINWRLAFGVDDKQEPEEWQKHKADIQLPVTLDIVNKPKAIWEAVAAEVFRK